MRVTFLLPSYVHTPSGGFLVVYTLANALAARGHDVVVLHPTDPPHRDRLGLRIEGRRVLRRRANALRGMGPAPWMNMDRRVRMRYVPTLNARWVPDGDVLVATGWSTAYAAADAGDRCGIGHYLIQSDESLWDPNVDLARESWRLPLRKAVIANWLLDVAKARGCSDVAHIPLAVDREVFNLRRPILGRAPHVGMLASTNPIKRTDLGFDLLDATRAVIPDLKVSVFGTPPNGLPVPDCVDLVGVVSQQRLSELFNRTSVYLCTSQVEGWHLPPAEAMSCGSALVSSDIGGVRDYARHRDTAWLAPVDNPALLLEGLIHILRNEQTRTDIAGRGLKEIGSHSWQRTIERFENWISESRVN